MIGTPVEVIEELEKGKCRVTKANSVTFHRGQETGVMTGSRAPVEMQGPYDCSTLKR
jgi:hypothetical protein